MPNDEQSIWSMIQQEVNDAPFGVRVLLNKEIMKIIRLDPNVTYIGRMPENHVVLDDAKVSRSHARIVHKDGAYHVEDQESENGILLNGEKVKEGKLVVGDQVLVGNHILEVISADESIQPVQLDQQVDLYQDEEWRLDETISIQTGSLSREDQDLRKAGTSSGKVPLPTLRMTLKIGEDVIIRDVTLDKGKKLKAGTTGDNALFVALKVGKWLLEKKIPLE